MSNISKINIYCQKLKIKTLPEYKTLVKDDSPPVSFKVQCEFQKERKIGHGRTIKLAKENAAQQIVQHFDIDGKLFELENLVSYSIESYGVPLENIWNNTLSIYTVTLKKKIGNNYQYKVVKMQILDD
jgi:hypothetical protein